MDQEEFDKVLQAFWQEHHDISNTWTLETEVAGNIVKASIKHLGRSVVTAHARHGIDDDLASNERLAIVRAISYLPK